MSTKRGSGVKSRVGIAAIVVVLLLVGILIGNSISGYYVLRVEEDIGKIPSLSTDDFTEVNVGVEPAIIYLTGDCRQISMVTTLEQTTSIEMAIRNMEGTRPLTHDLITKQMKVFGMEVLMVKIHTLVDGTYYSDLVIRQGAKVLEMDARPSDTIAIALRMNAPIYVSNELMEEEGKAAC